MIRAPAMILRLLSAVTLGAAYQTTDAATAPHLYSQAAYQSPVQADPDDLLLLAGDGLSADDRVVYRSSREESPSPPAEIPARSSALLGVAPVVSAAGAPYQLIIRLPAEILTRHAYRLWVRNTHGEWSNAVSINDPRPLWISPSTVYATAATAFLPRYLKVIGRNLFPSGSDGPAVRLVGPKQYELRAETPGALTTAYAASEALRSFVAKRLLPQALVPGVYRVELLDHAHWSAVPQTLTVLPDPPRSLEFDVANPAFGGCGPDDGQDDTACVEKAVAAAKRAGGGAIVLGDGTWDLSSGHIELPPFVDIRGRSAGMTRILRHDRPEAPANVGMIVLLGHNVVRDLWFDDESRFSPTASIRPILQLGRRYNTDEQPQAAASLVSDVVITRNVFEKTYGAVVDGGSPIERLFVTYNRFGDYRLGLNLGGNRFNVHHRFGITDSVIAFNQFMPGSYIDLPHQQGAIASELGASRRVDFSSNVADGTNRTFLNSTDDAAGWRAAFFWHMNDNHEMLLISENAISCSGDKSGDGEAISLDNNANTFALPESQTVIRSSRDSVSVRGPLKAVQNNRPVDIDTYYLGHWLRIDAGRGIGQSRRIVAYRRDAGSGEISFMVDLPWDVPPRAGESRVSVAREYWQTLIVDNTVDQREPPCLKSNRTRPKGGNISVWAQTADSAVEGNRQYDTDGILFQQAYGVDDAACDVCDAHTSIPSFLEIRGNIINGEYDWTSACSLSGIMGSYAASPNHGSGPPPLSVGVSISHNQITHADSLYGGAINIVPTWYRGPAGYAQALVEGVMIHHNVIRDISGAAPLPACEYRQSGRFGIALQGDKDVDATILYKNICANVDTPLLDRGAHTHRVCDQVAAPSCECKNAN
jgi:hypothetical protein